MGVGRPATDRRSSRVYDGGSHACMHAHMIELSFHCCCWPCAVVLMHDACQDTLLAVGTASCYRHPRPKMSHIYTTLYHNVHARPCSSSCGVQCIYVVHSASNACKARREGAWACGSREAYSEIASSPASASASASASHARARALLIGICMPGLFYSQRPARTHACMRGPDVLSAQPMHASVRVLRRAGS